MYCSSVAPNSGDIQYGTILIEPYRLFPLNTFSLRAKYLHLTATCTQVPPLRPASTVL